MSGVRGSKDGTNNSDRNPQKPGRFSLPTINELKVFDEKLTEEGKPAIADRPNRGVNLERSKSVKQKEMSGQLEQHAMAEQKAQQAAAEAEKSRLKQDLKNALLYSSTKQLPSFDEFMEKQNDQLRKVGALPKTDGQTDGKNKKGLRPGSTNSQ